MAKGSGMAARVARAAKNIWGRKGAFLLLFFVVLGASVVALAYLDLLPEYTASGEEAPPVTATSTPAGLLEPENPVRITIPKIGLDAKVENPESVDIKVLDAALLKGAVRYPTSAELGEKGNVVLFGHSSYLPVVSNQSYKAFNDIQKLAPGDRITVAGQTREYLYEVTSVRKASAKEDGIPLAVAGQRLTLATCDSFGKKTDRFIVEAEIVESRVIAR